MARNAVKAKLDIIFKKIFTDKNNEDLFAKSCTSVGLYS